ncbi:MAG: phosphate signaling complex protein PhoU [Bacteroidetes bacterium]|nr:phosphate signaling complex protein PhoU [Bacteroidota bacterium]
MERHFEMELAKLNNRVIKMGNLVANQIHETMEALTHCDPELASLIISNDNQIDELDVKIDKLCQRIFALTQPVATDLRLIMASLKMNNDLERMGDIAVNIASKIEGIQGYQDIIKSLEIDDLAAKTEIIVHDVISILTTKNVVFIQDIFRDAHVIKDMIPVISAKIIDEMIHKSDVIVVATNLMIILTQIERIAGYSTNIAESIVFLVEGRIVKHTGLDEHFESSNGNV